jgi:hypothetical protein
MNLLTGLLTYLFVYLFYSSDTTNVDEIAQALGVHILNAQQVLPLDKLTTSWSSVNCSASIAVQVNLDDQKQQQKQQQKEQSTAESNSESNVTQKSTEISTQTDTNTDNDDDNDSGQLFYIPLQAVTRNTSAQGGQQLIQGVAVKLGTEGPTGPNQRVLLKAKLVTKPPISVARCPPIGTVQPTARLPQNVSTEQMDMPSTSTHNVPDAAFKVPAPEEKGTRMASAAASKFVSSQLSGRCFHSLTFHLALSFQINNTPLPFPLHFTLTYTNLCLNFCSFILAQSIQGQRQKTFQRADENWQKGPREREEG